MGEKKKNNIARVVNQMNEGRTLNLMYLPSGGRGKEWGGAGIVLWNPLVF